MTLDKLFYLYIGRKPIKPIPVRDYADFIKYLEQQATRVDNRTARKPFMSGIFSENTYFYEGAGSLVIRYEPASRHSGWHFEGEVIGDQPNGELHGQFKGSLLQEAVSCLALAVFPLGLLGVAGNLFIGNPADATLSFYLLVAPAAIFSLRWLNANISLFGENAVGRITKLLNKY